MAIEIVDFRIKNGGSFHCYVNVHQRVVDPQPRFLEKFHQDEEKTPMEKAVGKMIRSRCRFRGLFHM